jgi:hypothetical protein
MPGDINIPEPGPFLWRLAVGFVAACGASACVLAVMALAQMPADQHVPGLVRFGLEGAVVYFLGALLVSGPTFLIIRALLHVARRRDLVSFALGGALNAHVLISLLGNTDFLVALLRPPTNMAVPVAGAMGGVACWWAERRLAGRQV